MSKSSIINHLMARPISPILGTQSDSEVALKIMCIIDYCLEKSHLYSDILQYPKLLEQLLRFKSYEQFQYYEYKMKKTPFSRLVLGCQCCELVAPYAITLEHMVLNHGRHRSAEECQWCCKLKIHEHIASNTLEQCYSEYIDQHQINVDPHVCQLIETVFVQLRLLADDLGVRTTRYSSYRACNHSGKEIIVLDDTDDDDISSEVLVTKPLVRNKMMKFDQLDKFYQEAMRYFDGDTKQMRYSPCHMRDQSIPRVQQMQTSPQHTQFQFQQQQQPQPQPQPPSTLPPLISSTHTNNISSEITNLANFMITALQAMRNDKVRMKALFNIHKTILQFSAEDLQMQLGNRNNE